VAVLALTFGIVALAELADTSGLVTLVLASRFPARLVLLGVAAGFLVQVLVAIAAGSLVALLPERLLAAAVAVIFLVSAVLLLRGDDDDDDDAPDATPTTPWRVVALCFGITLLSELGDPTQIIVATLTARYDDPLAVGIGAVLALWAVSALAVFGGNRLRRVVSQRWLTRVAAGVMEVLAVASAVEAIRG
jgi:putative Ca2+/H+ antiporter (TMEM165/GDT1 family)